MSRTINRVELLGRVGTEPEMKYTPGGTPYTKLRLATDRRRQDGETTPDWHSVVCWGKTAEAVNQYVDRGGRIYVAGRLVQNSWEGDDGQRRHRTEIHAQEVVFLDSRNGGAQEQAGDEGSPLLARHRIATPDRRAHHGAAPTHRGRPRSRSNR